MSSRSANENFLYNSMLASALAQLLPANERKVIRLWIDRLYNVVEANQMSLRNDYMWFMLLTLQNKRIIYPFNEIPNSGELKPLSDILPQQLYNEVVNSTADAANLAWVDQILSRNIHGGPNDSQVGKTTQQRGGANVPPSKFLQNQPKPQSGVICYMGAFSDQHKF